MQLSQSTTERSTLTTWCVALPSASADLSHMHWSEWRCLHKRRPSWGRCRLYASVNAARSMISSFMQARSFCSLRLLHSASRTMSLEFTSARASELRENMDAVLSEIKSASPSHTVSSPIVPSHDRLALCQSPKSNRRPTSKRCMTRATGRSGRIIYRSWWTKLRSYVPV